MTGQFVKERIVAAGYKLADVARAVGITPQSLDERLSAKDMKVGVLTEIAMAIQQPLAYFFEDFGKPLTGDILMEPIVPYGQNGRNQQADPNLKEKIRMQDEIISAQRKTIEAYERMIAQIGKS